MVDLRPLGDIVCTVNLRFDWWVRRRRAVTLPPAESTCPACGLTIEEDDHAVHVRRGAYHADCVLYSGDRAGRERWTLGA